MATKATPQKSHAGPLDLKTEVHVPNPKSLDGVPDLCMMTYLGEGNVVHNLDCRYKLADMKQRCYTSMTAKVLVAMNPYERMDANYTQDVMAAYQARPINLEGLVGAGDLPPHVFTVANSAFHNLVANRQNQSIIVCGESGSGKTESAKYMMRFLAFTTTSTSLDPTEYAEAEAVGQQVLDANPILESFGNAKTLINNNSSRFGKFTKMLFVDTKKDSSGKIRKKLAGACIDTYLLEKSRVVFQDKGERNYHVFYQLTHMHKERPDLKLDHPDKFNYTAKSGCWELDDLRYPGALADGEWFKELKHAFKTLLIPEEEVTASFRIVSGILHMGNIEFKDKSGGGSDIVNPGELAIAAEMFGVDEKSLRNRLETRTMYLPAGGSVIQPLNEEGAKFNRDSLARNLYNGLFRWIVWRINQQSSKDSEASGTTWIGILDVFGFEIFQNNSFEQFCINFANERLQQFFNFHVLQAEQDLYKREALLWDPIELPNNQETLDLVMSKPNGIVALLDSTCVQPKGDAVVFVTNLFQARGFHPRLRKPKATKAEGDKQMTTVNGFVIRHYAGEVTYNCDQFLVKNSDASEFDNLILFETAKNDLAKLALRMRPDGGIDKGDLQRNNKRAFLSTGSVFVDQLNALMSVLEKTAPYFVRCIKPNANKKAKDFIQDFVRPQLRCGGLIEALRIIKLGFPTRCSYKRVNELFNEILRKKPVTNLNLRDFTQGIMRTLGSKTETLDSSQYQLGLTMVFFRPGKQSFLTDILEKDPKSVTDSQVAEIRKWLIHKRWVRARGTVKAWLTAGRMLQEMRFKKAALSMVVMYRTLGRVLGEARSRINGNREEEEAKKRARDVEFQNALRAKQELERLTELKKKQDAEVAQMQKNHQQAIAQKDEEIAASQAKLAELNNKSKELKQQLDESNSKRLAHMNETKNQIADLNSKLAAETSEVSELRKKQQALLDEKEALETNLDKSRNAMEDLRRSMGLGSAEYERQISEKDRRVAELQERIKSLEEQLRVTKETLGSQINQLKADLERSRADARSEQERLEGMVRDRDANLSRLQSELAILKTSTDQRIKDQEAALEDARSELKNQREKSQKQLNERDSELNDVKRDLALAQGKLETASSSASDHQRRAQESQTEALAKQNELKEKYDKELKKLESKLADATRDLAIARDQVDNSKKELGSSNAANLEKIAALERALKEKEAEVEELREELSRTKAKLDAAQKDSEAKLATLQADLTKARADARELQTRFDRESWEKTNELQNAKSELALIRDKLQAEKESVERTAKGAQDSLSQERELSAQRIAKLTAELQSKSDDYRELKAEYKAEKREWRNKQDKLEKSIQDLEAQLDAIQLSAQSGNSKQADAERAAREAAAEAESKSAKAQSKLKDQLDELRNDMQQMEEQLVKARAERQKAVDDTDAAIQGYKERELKYKDDIARLKSEIDKLERDYILYKQQSGDEVEQKLQALQARVALLQNVVDDLKADKLESKERENQLQDQLKESLSQAAEAKSALRALQTSHGAELDKLRLGLETAREKALIDQTQHHEQLEAASRKQVESQSLITELKTELHEAVEREAQAQAALRDAQSGGKDDAARLASRNAELEEERKQWQSQRAEYERKVGESTTNYHTAKAQLAELQHKKAMGDGSKAENALLRAKLEAAERALADKDKAFARQLKLKQDEWQSEKDSIDSEFKRAIKQKDEQAKAQNEAYKYKLQYLELSGRDLQNERKRWSEKEREFEKTLISLTAQLRELRAEHQQAVDVADAFRAHVEAKEAARQAETQSFEVKRQALNAEHNLALRQLASEKESRVASLERDLIRVKDELADALAEIDSLRQGQADAKHSSFSDSLLYGDEPAQAPAKPASSSTVTTTYTPYREPENESLSGIPLDDEPAAPAAAAVAAASEPSVDHSNEAALEEEARRLLEEERLLEEAQEAQRIADAPPADDDEARRLEEEAAHLAAEEAALAAAAAAAEPAQAESY